MSGTLLERPKLGGGQVEILEPFESLAPLLGNLTGAFLDNVRNPCSLQERRGGMR